MNFCKSLFASSLGLAVNVYLNYEFPLSLYLTGLLCSFECGSHLFMLFVYYRAGKKKEVFRQES
jgi:hypothetical protein